MHRGAEEYHGNDVATAIEQYIHKFPASGKSNQGNGDVEIERVGLRSSSDTEFVFDDTYTHENGTPLQVRLEYRINNPEIKSFRGSLIILDQQLREVLSCAADDLEQVFEVPVGADTVKVDVSLPIIYPNSGRHTFTVLASDPATKNIYCRTTNAKTFMARAPSMGWATNIVRCPWNAIR
ncbi:MAG: hypothetical protein EOL87_17850 [Spartobacteria bacterium]|nr:hypothetical protein [Spartobacteria bacterium]